MKNLLVAVILALCLSLCNLGDNLRELGKKEQNSNQSSNSQPNEQNSNQSNSDTAETGVAPPQPGNSNGNGAGSADTVSGGILNSKATSLPKPAYPRVAKAAGASGTVLVQVIVDETGKVTYAKATSGHPLLQQSAVQAAYQARFTPTKLAGKPVKVSGTISYNFVPE
ncbi:MAG TPA: TonB family protein [Pyrinomonadaceae bacterium]|jgi:TonB family protein